MVPLFWFTLLALFHPVLLYTPDQRWDMFLTNCHPFLCGKLGGGNIEFPYRNATAPDYCGPFLVDDCDKAVQKIQLEKGGKWYQVDSISQSNTINVTDTEVQGQLKRKSCQAFNNLTLPDLHPQGLVLPASKNMTLFKCSDGVNISLQELAFNYTGCNDFNIYYTYHNKSLPMPPPNCSILQLPVNTNSQSYDDIFQMLTATFSLDVFYNLEQWLGFKCIPVGNREFKCSRPDQVSGNQKLGLKLGLGLGIPAAVAIPIILLGYCMYKRKYAYSDFVSANTSSALSSKSNMEESNIYFGVPIFSHTELEEATNNFHSENELGDGGFGTVYYGKLRDGREVAIKRLYEHNVKRFKQFMNEIEILTLLRHKNLVLLYGCTSRRSRELLLVYEYIPNGTVADHLHGDLAKSNPLAWPIRMKIAIETASALAYLHASEIIHRDVKTNNILLDNNFCVKVADFGLSRLFPNHVTHVSTTPQGTPGYVDPEYYHCYQLTNKSDVYSFGVVLVELISSMPAVDITRRRNEINLASLAINRIQKGPLDELIDPCLGYNSDEEVTRMTSSVAELAFLCLQQGKEMRPTMNEVLEELRRIESGEYKLEHNNDNEEASLPPDCSALLLRYNKPQRSPISVVEKWDSSSSSTLPKVSREDFLCTD